MTILRRFPPPHIKFTYTTNIIPYNSGCYNFSLIICLWNAEAIHCRYNRRTPIYRGRGFRLPNALFLIITLAHGPPSPVHQQPLL